MRLGQDQKEKNKVKEADAKRSKRDYKRAKETGEKKKKPGEWTKRQEQGAREIGGTQNLRPEKRRKLTGGVMSKGSRGETNINRMGRDRKREKRKNMG